MHGGSLWMADLELSVLLIALRTDTSQSVT